MKSNIDKIQKELLKTILYDNKILFKYYELITRDLFNDENVKIFDLYSSLIKSEAITEYAIISKLKDDREGCILFGVILTHSKLNADEVNSAIKYLYECKLESRLLNLMSDSNSKIGKEDIFDIINNISDTVSDMVIVRKSNIIPIKEATESVIQQIISNIENDNKMVGFGTGFKYLDKFTGGMQRGDLVIIAGETSQGKTSLALDIMYNSALNFNTTCLFGTLEMTIKQLTSRLISKNSHINSKKILTSKLDQWEYEKISANVSRLNGLNILMVDSHSNLYDIINIIKNEKIKHNIEMVCIDYLQLITNKEKGQNKEQEIGNICRTLKNLAKQLDICIILLSQLSRGQSGYGKINFNTHKPTLSRLRDSGQIEESADVVIFVYRPEYFNIEYFKSNNQELDNRTTSGRAMIYVAKGRNIGITEFILNFNKEYTLFSDFSLDEPDSLNLSKIDNECKF